MLESGKRKSDGRIKTEMSQLSGFSLNCQETKINNLRIKMSELGIKKNSCIRLTWSNCTPGESERERERGRGTVNVTYFLLSAVTTGTAAATFNFSSLCNFPKKAITFASLLRPAGLQLLRNDHQGDQ